LVGIRRQGIVRSQPFNKPHETRTFELVQPVGQISERHCEPIPFRPGMSSGAQSVSGYSLVVGRGSAVTNRLPDKRLHVTRNRLDGGNHDSITELPVCLGI
jgi:hypothetical protein